MVRTIVDKESGFHRVVDDEKGPLEEINAFLRSLEARGLSPLTVRAYAFDLVAFYRWLEGTDRSLKELTQADLLDFIAWEKRRCAQPKSINRRLTVCRLLHGFWFPGGLVARAGVSLSAPYYRGPGRDRYIGVHKLRKKPALALRVKEPKKLVTPLDADQVRKYLRGLRRYRDIAIVHLMLLCGLRSREVLTLSCRNISLQDRFIRVMGKGNNERVVPLAQLAALSIEQYLTYERPRSCADDTLFVCLQGKHRGRHMTAPGLRSIFRSRRRKPELSSANPHRFRHTFSVDMIRNGMSLPALQKLLGHANIETTLIYVNLSLTDIADAYLAASSQIQKRYDLD